MSLHQIIYTSCKRGRNSANDGQQVYSYDAGFDQVNSEDYTRLFAYQHPACRSMTEELAAAQPRSFTYRALDNQWVGLAMNTYLGRDYMGAAGRFGNHLSHVILCQREELPDYPCRYYGSPSLRTAMDPAEVNNPACPDYLPTPELTPGDVVSVDAVVDFLAEEGRMDIYLNMLCGVLRYSTDRKRVVICDRPENVILWIAALEYALPLNCVRDISFTTYEYDPALSTSRICGVVPEGTNFTWESRQEHFVFDLLTGQCQEFPDKDPEFFEFVDTALSFSYDALEDFHGFLTRGYTYTEADQRICHGYALYAALSDGFRGMSRQRLADALAFADQFGTRQEQARIAQVLFARRDYFLLCSLDVFLAATDWLSGRPEGLDNTHREALRTLSVDRILSDFSRPDARETDFRDAYGQLCQGCRRLGFSLATELMRPENRPKLFAVLEQGVNDWKINFLVQVISEFVKDGRLPVTQLAPEAPIGQTYQGIVQRVVPQGGGYALIRALLDGYSDDGNYLIHMALSLESMLAEQPNGVLLTEGMWKYYDQLLSAAPAGHFDAAWRALYQCRRYDRIYALYGMQLDRAGSLTEARRIWENHYQNMVRRDSAYADRYTTQVVEAYYQHLREDFSQEAEDARQALLEIIARDKLPVDFGDELVRQLLKRIPLRSPDYGVSGTVRTMVSYTCGTRQRPLEGKLLLLMVGMTLEKVLDGAEMVEKLGQLERLAQGRPTDLGRLSERGEEDYLEWIVPNVVRLCGGSGLRLVQRMFLIPDDIAAEFYSRCWKLYLKEAQSSRDYRRFCEFLAVALERGSDTVDRRLGQLADKMGRSKGEALNREVRDAFRQDQAMLARWEAVLDAGEDPEDGEPGRGFSRGLGGLFRKRRDKGGE